MVAVNKLRYSIPVLLARFIAVAPILFFIFGFRVVGEIIKNSRSAIEETISPHYVVTCPPEKLYLYITHSFLMLRRFWAFRSFSANNISYRA